MVNPPPIFLLNFTSTSLPRVLATSFFTNVSRLPFALSGRQSSMSQSLPSANAFAAVVMIVLMNSSSERAAFTLASVASVTMSFSIAWRVSLTVCLDARAMSPAVLVLRSSASFCAFATMASAFFLAWAMISSASEFAFARIASPSALPFDSPSL